MREIYRPLALGRSPVIEMSRRGAELTKYAGNAFLATKITFINEIADLCEKVGADVQEVARGIGLDNRIGSKFLHAGPGYGGSCFPKDTLALLKTADDFDSPLRIVEAVVTVNDRRKRAMGRKVIEAAGGNVRDKTVAILGLAFKPNTDDMRDAPSIAIIQTLQDAGAVIRAYDPKSMDQARLVLENVAYFDSPYAAMEGADILVIVTEWDEFRALDLARVKSLLREPAQHLSARHGRRGWSGLYFGRVMNPLRWSAPAARLGPRLRKRVFGLSVLVPKWNAPFRCSHGDKNENRSPY